MKRQEKRRVKATSSALKPAYCFLGCVDTSNWHFFYFKHTVLERKEKSVSTDSKSMDKVIHILTHTTFPDIKKTKIRVLYYKIVEMRSIVLEN